MMQIKIRGIILFSDFCCSLLKETWSFIIITPYSDKSDSVSVSKFPTCWVFVYYINVQSLQFFEMSTRYYNWKGNTDWEHSGHFYLPFIRCRDKSSLPTWPSQILNFQARATLKQGYALKMARYEVSHYLCATETKLEYQLWNLLRITI